MARSGTGLVLAPFPIALSQQLQQEFGCEHLEQPSAYNPVTDWPLHSSRHDCPLCGTGLSFVHLLWECSYWKGKVKEIPDEWKDRVSHDIEPEIWHRGLSRLPFRERHGGPSTLEGTGKWQDLQPCHVDPGHACCLDTVVTCVDKRHQQHIFAIGIFEIATKECVASIMGICPGGSSKQRATVYALKQLALHILDSTHVGISNLQVWKSWTPHLAMERFPDLHQGLEFEDYEHLRPLLFLSHLQQEEGMKTSKTLQKSIKRLAQARAKEEAPTDFLAYQKAIDEDMADILTVAAERMDMLLRDQEHFLRKRVETTQEVRTPLVQQKKDLITFLLQNSTHGGHDWQAHRGGAICGQCRAKVHVKSMLQEIKEAMGAECRAPVKEKEIRKPRMVIIQQLIEAQDKPQDGVHFLRLD